MFSPDVVLTILTVLSEASNVRLAVRPLGVVPVMVFGSCVAIVFPETVTVTRVNRAESSDFQYDNFYAAQATEIVVNSSSRLFETGDFALEVAERAGRDVSEAGAIDFARSFKVKQLAPHLLRVRAVDRDEATARAALEAATAELAERVAAMELAEPREGETVEGQPAFQAVPGTIFSYERTYSQGVVLGAGFVAGLLLGLAVVVLEAAMRSGRTPAKTRS